MPIFQVACKYTGWRDFGFDTRTARESATGVDTGADESARKSSTLKSSKTLVDGSGAAKDSVDVSAAVPLIEVADGDSGGGGGGVSVGAVDCARFFLDITFSSKLF